MKNLTLIVGDILDNSKLFDSMKNHDIVIHLAAKTDVIDSIIILIIHFKQMFKELKIYLILVNTIIFQKLL